MILLLVLSLSLYNIALIKFQILNSLNLLTIKKIYLTNTLTSVIYKISLFIINKSGFLTFYLFFVRNLSLNLAAKSLKMTQVRDITFGTKVVYSKSYYLRAVIFEKRQKKAV